MDPTTCFLTILDHIRANEYGDARTYAAILRNWIDRGGFYPEGFRPESVDAVLSELLKPACAPNALRTTFQSITCYECDAGQHIGSLQQSIAEGWTEIVGDPDLTVTSHLGTCPVCRAEQDQESPNEAGHR